MQIKANQNFLSVRDLNFMFSETLSKFTFTGLRSFGNPPNSSAKFFVFEVNNILCIFKAHICYK